MVLLSALIAVIGGQSIAAVFGAFTAAEWIGVASTLIGATPDVIEALEIAIPAFAGAAAIIEKGVEDAGPLLSDNFKKWAAENAGNELVYDHDGSLIPAKDYKPVR